MSRGGVGRKVWFLGRGIADGGVDDGNLRQYSAPHV